MLQTFVALIPPSPPHCRHEDVSYPLSGGPLHGTGGEGGVEQLMVADHLGQRNSISLFASIKCCMKYWSNSFNGCLAL